METNSSFLKYGDRVCFYSENGKGFLSVSGINHQNFYVAQSNTKKLALVPNQRHMVFQVLPRLNYNIARDHEKLLNKLEGNGSESLEGKVRKQLQSQLAVQEQRKHSEQQNNDNTIANLRGQLVLYGDSV